MLRDLALRSAALRSTALRSIALRSTALLLALLLGCSDPVAERDGGIDAGSDAGALDGGADAGSDAGVLDSGADAAIDAGVLDGGADAGIDSGVLYGGADAGPSCSPLASPHAETVRAPTGLSYATSLVWTGSEFAAVWVESSQIWFAQISAAGVPVAGSVHRLFSGTESEIHPHLAVGDGELGVVFQRSDTDPLMGRTSFVRVDFDGTVFGTELILDSVPSDRGPTAIAWSDTLREWAVAWVTEESTQHVRVTRIDDTDAVLGTTTGLETLSNGRFRNLGGPTLVWTGSRFAVAVEEYDTLPASRLLVVELDPRDGSVTHRIVMDELPSDSSARVLNSLATDGSHYIIGWDAYTHGDSTAPREAKVRLATVGGSALGTVVSLDTMVGNDPYATYLPDGTGFIGYWSRITTGGYEIVRRRISSAGTAGTMESLVTHSAAMRVVPASSGCNDAVLWDALSFSDFAVRSYTLAR